MIFVTGSNGFLGKPLVDRLERESMECLGIDLFQDQDVMLANRIVGNYADSEAFLQTMCADKGKATLVHLAARNDLRQSVFSPQVYLEDNFIRPSRYLSKVADKLSRLIYVSTCSVYDSSYVVPLCEDHLVQPASPYASAKYRLESFIRTELSSTNCSVVVLRLFNLIGPLNSQLVTRPLLSSRLFAQVLMVAKGLQESVEIFGSDFSTPDGTPVRDYVHLHDVVELLVRILNSSTLPPFSLFNVGTGSGTSVLQVISKFEEHIGRTIPKKFSAKRMGDVPVRIADISRVSSQLDWTPIHDIDKSIMTVLLGSG